MTAAPNDDLVWVAERGGRILRVNLAKGEVAQIVLDISEETTVRSEQGLLDIALTTNWLYVSFTDLAGNSRIDAFKREGSGVGSHRETILTLQQPFSNHNGGGLAFGDDGYLYIGFGDGGSAGDPHNHGQNPQTLLGTIVRINPTPGTANPYTIPTSNPYAQNSRAGAPEVFLIGLRNPWRFSFDQTTGDLWIADVGQNRYEEINMLPAESQTNNSGIDNWAGSNLGWKLREGKHPYCADCQQETNLLEPIWVYPHGDACSVTGGFVYRGSAIEGLYGWYLFGDYCTSKIWGLDISTESTTFKDFNVEIPGGQLASFGQDKHGELYTLSLQGKIAQIRPK
ncbi:MAG: PQQ-dependent sugar dehydrogenase [Acidimicrobiaceae bacterium]|nr:PQQ-dependent sugar dehydrogenase [Acidimicrobiaceae bacterium]